MPSMMHSPVFYAVLMAVLVLAVVLPMVVILALASGERAGGEASHDRHLG